MEPTLRERALRLLARRDHSRVELVRKLATHATSEEIDSLATQLEQSGLLSDARFAESFVAARGARLGTLKLRHELKNRGIAPELIEAHAARDTESELESARALWLRKFGSKPADARDYAKQARFLAARGFSSGVVHRLLKDPLGDAQ
ncbi:MAG: recombination regulator RecX [Candidatus Methylophosphatis roskildensis]